MSVLDTFKRALACKCPRCNDGALYCSGYAIELRERCAVCDLDFTKNDSADGPAVFLIFVLGGLLVPIALVFDAYVSPPLWVHAVVWTVVSLSITVGTLRPLKAFIIALQFKHRPGDWE
ncbi:MAG: hypothetical protein COA45_09180 [Zetaproteobacteria bacterium]|nr:MAG: hypothetical protein COA45_09180 [Zetaproteobacteria bacterium]